MTSALALVGKIRLTKTIYQDIRFFSLLCLFVALVVSHFDFDSDSVRYWSLLTFYFFGNKKPRYIIQRANSKSIDMPALKILSSLVFAHVYGAVHKDTYITC